MSGVWPWIAFNLFVVVMLAVDLGIFHRKAHIVSMPEAAAWTTVWVSLALVFGLGVGQVMGQQAALEYLSGYLIEKALSVDNIFVFVLIFGYFRVPRPYQHRVLFWGILGALVLRGGMIAGGVVLLDTFHWIIYVFGIFLIVTGVRLGFSRETNIAIEANPIVRILKRFVPVGESYEGQRFFVERRSEGRARRFATPLFVVLVMVETTDLVFALDSIPAVFAVTRDPFLVYTSNVFAILGLRALYFLLAGVIHRIRFLKLGLAGVLTFVGGKMALADLYRVPTGVSLAVIAGLLGTSVLASILLIGEQREAAESVPPPPPAGRRSHEVQTTVARRADFEAPPSSVLRPRRARGELRFRRRERPGKIDPS